LSVKIKSEATLFLSVPKKPTITNLFLQNIQPSNLPFTLVKADQITEWIVRLCNFGVIHATMLHIQPIACLTTRPLCFFWMSNWFYCRFCNIYYYTYSNTDCLW
jgi:hypothetical protein